MITDEIKIKVEAGKGGDGSVAFSKIKMSLGPTGGKGGNGGNVLFEGVSDLTALNKYKHKREHYAEKGQNGKNDKSSGRNGKDLMLTVPIGSVINNLETGEAFEITKVGQIIQAVKGGRGGRGNFYFRSPTNTSPEESEKGRPGQSFNFFIELRLIADIGLVGLPNAGKSSLINELTKAQAKVANYEFTTLEPNLGILDGLIIADIPGLIEGASEGRGLGIKFLRHIQRTKILFHCISLESDDLMRDYKIIRKELANYSKELIKKDEVVLLTKSDTKNMKEIKKQIAKFRAKKIKADYVSIYDWDSIERLKNKMLEFLT